jgi:hypothetical protein
MRMLRHHLHELKKCNDEVMWNLEVFIKFHVIKLIALRVIVGYALIETYTRIAA